MAGSGYLPRDERGMISVLEWKCYHCNNIVGPEDYRTNDGQQESSTYSCWAACKTCGDIAHSYTRLPMKWIKYPEVTIVGGLYK